MNTQINIFAEGNRLADLSKLGDPLEKLRVIDWSMFLPLLICALEKEHKGAGGRPAYPPLLMFKILVLQQVYNMADDQTEFQIKDRLTFMRFLGLSMSDKVPDAKTIWVFRERLVKANVMKDLFDLFGQYLTSKGLVSQKGRIVDATFVEVPRQRNTREENKEIKAGRIPEDWKKPENANKLRQKDTDARWTKKNKKAFFGNKNETKVDVESKVVTDYIVTTANVHDSKNFVDLVDPKTDNMMYGDSAFVGADIEKAINEKANAVKVRVVSVKADGTHYLDEDESEEIKEAKKDWPVLALMIHEKGYRKNPLTEVQKAFNKIKSQIRCRVEHVYGFMVNSMRGKGQRCIGFARAAFGIGLMNLIYNMFRYEFLTRPVT